MKPLTEKFLLDNLDSVNDGKCVSIIVWEYKKVTQRGVEGVSAREYANLIKIEEEYIDLDKECLHHPAVDQIDDALIEEILKRRKNEKNNL